VKYGLGIDVGSAYSKAVVYAEGACLSFAVMPSGGDFGETARRVAEDAIARAGVSRDDIVSTIATGYGAAMVDLADRSVTDISCHAAAIHQLAPAVRTLVDVGGQFSKAIRIDNEGRVTNFILNEKCAGGSGKFLQVMARILRVDIAELGPMSLTSDKPVEFTTSCAVFAESEVVSRIAEGVLPADILAGIHKAMASKIANLVTRLGLVRDCAVTGGGAKDAGLVRAIAREVGVPLFVHDEPQITAALGAALLGLRDR
jgi:predicted CoA-substrate-specific enzyme activase